MAPLSLLYKKFGNFSFLVMCINEESDLGNNIFKILILFFNND